MTATKEEGASPLFCFVFVQKLFDGRATFLVVYVLIVVSNDTGSFVFLGNRQASMTGGLAKGLFGVVALIEGRYFKIRRGLSQAGPVDSLIFSIAWTACRSSAAGVERI